MAKTRKVNEAKSKEKSLCNDDVITTSTTSDAALYSKFNKGTNSPEQSNNHTYLNHRTPNSLSSSDDSNSSETPIKKPSLFDIRVKPISTSSNLSNCVKPLFSKPVSSKRSVDLTDSETVKFSESLTIGGSNVSSKNKCFKIIPRSANSIQESLSPSVGSKSGSPRNSPRKSESPKGKVFPGAFPKTKSSQSYPVITEKEKCPSPNVKKVENNVDVQERGKINVFESIKEAIYSLPRENKTPIVYIQDVMKSQSVSDFSTKKLCNSSSDIQEKSDEASYEKMDTEKLNSNSNPSHVTKDIKISRNSPKSSDMMKDVKLLLNSPKPSELMKDVKISRNSPEPSDVMKDVNLSLNSKSGEKDSKSPPVSTEVIKKSVGKIALKKDGDSVKTLVRIGDKKKVVILTVSKDEGSILKSVNVPKSVNTPKSVNVPKSVNTLTKEGQLEQKTLDKTIISPELKKALTVNTSLPNLSSDSKETLTLPQTNEMQSPSSSPSPKDGDSPRQGRRIRSPSVRYADDMILFPLKSPRKSKESSKSCPTSTESGESNEVQSSEAEGKFQNSRQKTLAKELPKTAASCQTSQLYSLLTGELKTQGASKKDLKTNAKDTGVNKNKSDASVGPCNVPQSSAVRVLKFADKKTVSPSLNKDSNSANEKCAKKITNVSPSLKKDGSLRDSAHEKQETCAKKLTNVSPSLNKDGNRDKNADEKQATCAKKSTNTSPSLNKNGNRVNSADEKQETCTKKSTNTSPSVNKDGNLAHGSSANKIRETYAKQSANVPPLVNRDGNRADEKQTCVKKSTSESNSDEKSNNYLSKFMDFCSDTPWSPEKNPRRHKPQLPLEYVKDSNSGITKSKKSPVKKSSVISETLDSSKESCVGNVSDSVKVKSAESENSPVKKSSSMSESVDSLKESCVGSVSDSVKSAECEKSPVKKSSSMSESVDSLKESHVCRVLDSVKSTESEKSPVKKSSSIYSESRDYVKDSIADSVESHIDSVIDSVISESVKLNDLSSRKDSPKNISDKNLTNHDQSDAEIVIKVNSINVNKDNTQGTREDGLFGLIAKLESNLNSGTKLPSLLTESPFYDSVMVNEEEEKEDLELEEEDEQNKKKQEEEKEEEEKEQEVEEQEGEKEQEVEEQEECGVLERFSPLASNSSVDSDNTKKIKDVEIVRDIEKLDKGKQSDIDLKTESDICGEHLKIEKDKILFDKPVSPDVILVDSATSSSQDESASATGSKPAKNDLTKDLSVHKSESSSSVSGICPPDSTTTVENDKYKSVSDDNKVKGTTDDVDESKGGSRNRCTTDDVDETKGGSRNIFDVLLADIASPLKAGQKKEEEPVTAKVCQNKEEEPIIVKVGQKKEEEPLTAKVGQEKGEEPVTTKVGQKKEEEAETSKESNVILSKVSELNIEKLRNDTSFLVKKENSKEQIDITSKGYKEAVKDDEDDDVIIVKIDKSKQNRKTSSIHGTGRSSAEHIKQKLETVAQEVRSNSNMSSKKDTSDTIYDLTDDSDVIIVQKENVEKGKTLTSLVSESESSSSRILGKRYAKNNIIFPAPLDVLKAVEIENSSSMSAFTSENLDNFLKSAKGLSSKSPSKSIRDHNQSDDEEIQETDEVEIIPELDPDFDEVDGLLFMSFASEDTLNAHVHVEQRTNIGRNENLLLGMSRIKRLRQQQRNLPSHFHSKFNRLKKLKLQSKIDQNLRGMHKALAKYQRLYRLQLEKVYTERGEKLPVRRVTKTLQKTSDVTKIKGWKNKYGNTEEFAEATGLPLTKSGKFHWRTEERLLKNLNSQELKDIGLNLKKKRRKNLIFTVRKGMSKGENGRQEKSAGAVSRDSDFYGSDDDESVEPKTDDEDMNDDHWFPKHDDPLDRSRKIETKMDQSKHRLAMKRLNLTPEEMELIKKLGGYKTKLETPKEPGLGTYLSPSGRVVKRRKKRRKIVHLTTITRSLALEALTTIDPAFVKPETKLDPDQDPSWSSVKKEDDDDYPSEKIGSVKSCDKPGCRYGCICHLCRYGDLSSDPENCGKSRPPSCDKEYCRLGCICDSIEAQREKRRRSSHCGKPDCMIQCVCGKDDGLKKKLFSPNSSHSDLNDSVIQSDLGTEEQLPLLTHGTNDDVGNRKGKTVRPVQEIPKRKPTYRLAKNLDAVSRKAMLLYETSEMYAEMKVRKRKSRDSQDGQDTVVPLSNNKAKCGGSANSSKSNTPQSRNTASAHGGQSKKGSGWKASFRPCSSEHKESADIDEDWNSDVDEYKDYTSCARTVAYNPSKSRLSKKCTCSDESHHSAHIQNNDIKSQPSGDDNKKSVPSGDAASPVVISPGNSPPTTPEPSDPMGSKKSESGAPKGGVDVRIPLQVVWHTQWVCLKANKRKLEEEGRPVNDDVRLLEINSNCNWEISKQKILSRISAQLSKEGYPKPKRIQVGEFIIEFLPKSLKPAVIPPEVRAKLPHSIFSVRINIVKAVKLPALAEQAHDLNVSKLQNFIQEQEQILTSSGGPKMSSTDRRQPGQIITEGRQPIFTPFRITPLVRQPLNIHVPQTQAQVVTTPSTSNDGQERTSPLGIPSGGISGFSRLQINKAGLVPRGGTPITLRLPSSTQSFHLKQADNVTLRSTYFPNTSKTAEVPVKQVGIQQVAGQGVGTDNSGSKLMGSATYIGSVRISNSSSFVGTTSHPIQQRPKVTSSTSVVTSSGLKSSSEVISGKIEPFKIVKSSAGHHIPVTMAEKSKLSLVTNVNATTKEVNVSFAVTPDSNSVDTKVSNPRIEGLRQGLQNILKCSVQETQKLVKLQTEKEGHLGKPPQAPSPVATPTIRMPLNIIGPFDSPVNLPSSLANMKLLKAQPVKSGSSPVIHLVPVSPSSSGQPRYATQIVVPNSSRPLPPMTRMVSTATVISNSSSTTSTSSASRELIAVPVNLTPMGQIVSSNSPFIPLQHMAATAPSITIPPKSSAISTAVLLPKLSVCNRQSSPVSTYTTPSQNGTQISETGEDSKGKKNEDGSHTVEETEGKKKKRKKKNDGNNKEDGETGAKKKTKKKKKVQIEEGKNEGNGEAGVKKKTKKKKKIESEEGQNVGLEVVEETTTEGFVGLSRVGQLSTSATSSTCVSMEGTEIINKSKEGMVYEYKGDTENGEEPPSKKSKVDSAIEEMKNNVNVLTESENQLNVVTKPVENSENNEEGIDSQEILEMQDDVEDDYVHSDVDETDIFDDVDSMKSSDSSLLVSKDLLQSVEIGAAVIRNIVQNVEGSDNKVCEDSEACRDRKHCVQKDNDTETDRNSNACISSTQDENTDYNAQSGHCNTNGMAKEQVEIGIDSDKTDSVKQTAMWTSEVSEKSEKEQQEESVGKGSDDSQTDLLDASVDNGDTLVIDLSDDEQQSGCENTGQNKKYDSKSENKGVHESEDKNTQSEKDSSDCKVNQISGSACDRNSDSDVVEKDDVIVLDEGVDKDGHEWKEISDLGTVIKISEEGIMSNADNQLKNTDLGKNSVVKGISNEGSESDDVEIITFEPKVDKSSGENSSTKKITGSRKRKTVQVVREDELCTIDIKKKRIVSPEVCDSDDDEVQSEPSQKDSCSIIDDDCDDEEENVDIINLSDDDDDVDIESISDSDIVYKQLRAQAISNPDTHTVHSCSLHSAPNKRKRKLPLEVIHNTLQDDVEYKEGNVWVPLPKDTRPWEERAGHNVRERQRRHEQSLSFSDLGKLVFSKPEIVQACEYTKGLPKVRVLERAIAMIHTLEKTFEKNRIETKMYTNRNNELRHRLYKLQAHLRNSGVSEAVIQGYLQKAAFVSQKLYQVESSKQTEVEQSIMKMGQNAVEQSIMKVGEVEVPVTEVPVQKHHLKSLLTKVQKNTDSSSSVTGKSAGNRTLPLAGGSPVPVQMISSQQVKQMALHKMEERLLSESVPPVNDKPDIYIDHAEDDFQEDEGVNEELPCDIGDLPAIVSGFENSSSSFQNSQLQVCDHDNSSNSSNTNKNITLSQQDTSENSKNTCDHIINEATGEVIKVEMAEGEESHDSENEAALGQQDISLDSEQEGVHSQQQDICLEQQQDISLDSEQQGVHSEQHDISLEQEDISSEQMESGLEQQDMGSKHDNIYSDEQDIGSEKQDIGLEKQDTGSKHDAVSEQDIGSLINKDRVHVESSSCSQEVVDLLAMDTKDTKSMDFVSEEENYLSSTRSEENIDTETALVISEIKSLAADSEQI